VTTTDAQTLWKAAQTGDLNTVNRLLTANSQQRDQEALDRALVQAVVNRRTEVVDALAAAGANPNQTTSIGTLLMWPATNGDLKTVKSLVKAGADFQRIHKGTTALGAALSENQAPVIDYLESLGAKCPADAALLNAAIHNNLKRAEQAIRDGADLEKTGGILEETPLQAAARRGNVDVAKLLLQSGANPNKKVKERTALYSAVAYAKSLEMVKTLVEAGANVNVKYYDETLVMAAANAGSLPILKLLVEMGVDPHAWDKDHETTAMDHAKSGKHNDVVDWLQGIGVEGARDAARKLSRELAKEFGGKPVEHSHGFLLNSKLAGYKCQFSLGAKRLGASVFGMKFADAEFALRNGGAISFSPEKPESRFGKMKPVAQATKALRIIVWRSAKTERISDGFLKKFCTRQRDRFKALKLSGDERVSVHAQAITSQWEEMDFNSLKPRLKIFADFITSICRKAQPQRQLFAEEWLLKAGPRSAGKVSAPAHSFGGKYEPSVACPECGNATNLMAQIDLSDPALPNTTLKGTRLPVFWCLACLEWDPAFFDLSETAPQALNRKGEIIAKKPKDDGEEDLLPRVVTLARVKKKAGLKSKVGGAPNWIQMDGTPDCPKCEKPMAFALQLASDSRIAFGDMGLLYAFVCPECKTAASLVQSH
jgi:ankyrin repeat protein